MKLFLPLAVLVILAAYQVSAEYSEKALYVSGDPELAELKELPVVEEQTFGLRRAKRATCDLLSGFGVGHSACAVHCKLKKYKGGYCNSKAICVCRN